MKPRNYVALVLSLTVIMIAPFLVYSYVAVNSMTLQVGEWTRSVDRSGSVLFTARLEVVSWRAPSQWSLLGFTIQDPSFSLTADQLSLKHSNWGGCCYESNGFRVDFWTNDSSEVKSLNSVMSNNVTLTMRATVRAGLYAQKVTVSTFESFPVNLCTFSGCELVVSIDHVTLPTAPGVFVIVIGETALVTFGALVVFYQKRRKEWREMTSRC